MKKLIILLVVLFLSIQGASLFAQTTHTSHNNSQWKESEYYYFNVPIEKIYSHRLGYVVVYRRGVNQMARMFLPEVWFTGVDGKGDLFGLGPGSEWPSMSLYYKNGEFSHIRLRVRRNRSHETWGFVPLNVNIDEHFKDIEEVHLEF